MILNQELVHEMSVPNEERAHGTVSVKTYAQYFIAGGGYFFTILVIAVFIFSEVCLHIILYNLSNVSLV